MNPWKAFIISWPWICALLFCGPVLGDDCVSKQLQMRLRAEQAGLHYISTQAPGIRRVVEGKTYAYIGANDQVIQDPETLERIKKLGVPPGYDRVWISPDPDSHIQAIGYDARGRKQYRYHASWNQASGVAKFARMRQFGSALPQIRGQVSLDLALPGLPRQKVLATLTRLLDETFIRVGNEEYAAENASYGLTTFRKSHVFLDNDEIRFDFVGKSGVHHDTSLRDAALAKIIRELETLPGDNLFRYQDPSGAVRSIGSDDLNLYLSAVSGGKFTAKDFRTWGGTVSDFKALIDAGPPASDAQATQAVQQAVEYASSRLGNTPEICRKNYIHPSVLQAYEDGNEAKALFQAVQSARDLIARGRSSLKLEELSALELLKLADRGSNH